MNALIRWLLSHTHQTRLLVLAIAVLAGVLAGNAYRNLLQNDFLRQLGEETRWNAEALRNQTLAGKSMGAVLIAGQMNALIRSAAQCTTPECAERLNGLPRELEALGRGIDGDGAFVVNGDGVIVASWDSKGRARGGNNVAFRPYFTSALDRLESVYPAVGSSTGERALYIAAPIYEEAGNFSSVAGVLAARINMRTVDRQLAASAGIGLLISPQGVVFGTSEPEWLFHLATETDSAGVAKIGALKQFGKQFEKGQTPKMLPFDPAQSTVKLGGKHYAVAGAPLRWGDPAGPWNVVLLSDLDGVLGRGHHTALGVAVGAAIAALLALLLRALREAAARNAALEETRRTSERLAAEAQAKARRADFVAGLQQARTPAALASEFFRRLADFLPLHQGALYHVSTWHEGRPRLHLTGSYGNAAAPAELNGGDGLAGQCAIDRRPLRLDIVPAETRPVESGLGATQPRALLIFPILLNDELLGVLELASLDPAFAETQEFINELLPNLSVNLELALTANSVGGTETSP